MYLKGSKEFGIWYPKGNELNLVFYIDKDWEGNVDDKKSISGATLYLGDCLVSWSRKKKPLMALSTIEEKYIASVVCCTQLS